MILLTLNSIELESMLQNVTLVSFEAQAQLSDIDDLIASAGEAGLISSFECVALQVHSNDVRNGIRFTAHPPVA